MTAKGLALSLNMLYPSHQMQFSISFLHFHLAITAVAENILLFRHTVANLPFKGAISPVAFRFPPLEKIEINNCVTKHFGGVDVYFMETDFPWRLMLRKFMNFIAKEHACHQFIEKILNNNAIFFFFKILFKLIVL